MKARQIPINNHVAAVFKSLRKKNELKYEHVFCDGQGRRYYEIKRSFASACKRTGVLGFHFHVHDLRHTFASQLVMNGVSLKAVQELMGHADLKMTLRDAHLSQEHLQGGCGFGYFREWTHTYGHFFQKSDLPLNQKSGYASKRGGSGT
jgi:integrase